MTRICICGGGNLGHVVAGYLAAQGCCDVDLLTRHPERWKGELLVHTPEGETLHGQIHHISSQPDEVVKDADIVLLCLPGFSIAEVLHQIAPVLSSHTLVGSVVSSTGFFEEALQILPEGTPLFGFQRKNVRDWFRQVDPRAPETWPRPFRALHVRHAHLVPHRLVDAGAVGFVEEFQYFFFRSHICSDLKLQKYEYFLYWPNSSYLNMLCLLFVLSPYLPYSCWQVFHTSSFQNDWGNQMFSTSTALTNSGATSLGVCPATPHPMAVTRKVRSGCSLA